MVEHELGLKPISWVAFIFRSKRANRIKLLVWDGTGLLIVSEVLRTGGFHWPRVGDGVMRLSAAQELSRMECQDLLKQIEVMTIRIATSDRRIKTMAGQAHIA